MRSKSLETGKFMRIRNYEGRFLMEKKRNDRITLVVKNRSLSIEYHELGSSGSKLFALAKFSKTRFLFSRDCQKLPITKINT